MRKFLSSLVYIVLASCFLLLRHVACGSLLHMVLARFLLLLRSVACGSLLHVFAAIA